MASLRDIVINALGGPERAAEIWAAAKQEPGRIAQGIGSALTLPGDVYSGRTPLNDPNTGMPTNEVMGRAATLAGLVSQGVRDPSPQFSPQTWYHGTAQPIEGKFSSWKAGQGNGASLEMGTYVTPDPNDASYWALRAASSDPVMTPRNFAEINPADIEGAQVMPVRVAPGKQRVVGSDEYANYYSPKEFAKQAWLARLRGYDSVLFKGVDEGAGPIDQMLILNPGRRIQSALTPEMPSTGFSLRDLAAHAAGSGLQQSQNAVPPGWQVY